MDSKAETAKVAMSKSLTKYLIENLDIDINTTYTDPMMAMGNAILDWLDGDKEGTCRREWVEGLLGNSITPETGIKGEPANGYVALVGEIYRLGSLDDLISDYEHNIVMPEHRVYELGDQVKFVTTTTVKVVE